MSPQSTNRRTHPKSKTGCKTCKRRKVKCGEERPACQNCIKHAVKCDFLLSTAQHSSPNSSLSSPRSNIDNDRNQSAVEPLAMQDLELFHNWCFSTYSTISSNPELQEVWRDQATQLAFVHPFVMRSILAVSALHVAGLRPEKHRHYMLLAMKHHSDAVTTARQLLIDVKPGDAPGLWMFTALTLIFKMGSPNSATELISPDADGLFQWVYLLRGVQTVMHVGIQELRSSAVRPLFNNAADKSLWRKTSTSQEVHLGQLLERIQSTDHPLKETFLSVMEELRQLYAGASDIGTGSYNFKVGPHEMTDCFIWPFHLPDAYINALQQNDPEALAILAHYCVLLKVWDQKCWWLHGVSDNLMSVIWASLDVEHRRWIEWPILRTEWLPAKSVASF